jgi:hypothetical protein
MDKARMCDAAQRVVGHNGSMGIERRRFSNQSTLFGLKRRR